MPRKQHTVHNRENLVIEAVYNFLRNNSHHILCDDDLSDASYCVGSMAGLLKISITWVDTVVNCFLLTITMV